MDLNQRAYSLCQSILDEPEEFGANLLSMECGAKVLDLGVHPGLGGLETGRKLAEICLAGLGEVTFGPCSGPNTRLQVNVQTDRPLLACLGSQYAGWQIQAGKFFAMGSGAMRIKAAKEAVIRELNLTDESEVAVGVLETSQLPDDDVCRKIAEDCHVSPKNLVLLAARTASLAGHVQVVARSVETCLHKLHELKFDLSTIASGFGSAPLPPIAADDVAGIGRTNDAILYGGTVTLWVREKTETLRQFGEKLPSSASAMHGRPFEQILRDAKFDFYQIDPHLFSPAEVCLVSLIDGQAALYGEHNHEVLARSFGQD